MQSKLTFEMMISLIKLNIVIPGRTLDHWTSQPDFSPSTFSQHLIILLMISDNWNWNCPLFIIYDSMTHWQDLPLFISKFRGENILVLCLRLSLIRGLRTRWQNVTIFSLSVSLSGNMFHSVSLVNRGWGRWKDKYLTPPSPPPSSWFYVVDLY